MPYLRITFALLLVCTSGWLHADDSLLDQPVRIHLMGGERAITLRATESITFASTGSVMEFAPGTFTIIPVNPIPPAQRYHLFSKTFTLSQTDEKNAYIAELHERGYDPEVMTIGKRIETVSGRVLDTRTNWVSIARASSKEEAESLDTKLESEGHFVWSQAETLTPGKGYLQVKAQDGALLASFDAPLSIQCAAPILIDNVDIGFWDSQRHHLAYSGELQIGIGPEGRLELLEVLPIEEYLRGVLPAEMPWEWAPEALKAQAVAARTEVMAHLGSRYTLEGFDFHGNEQSRAYVGAGGHKPTTDQALRATVGQIVVNGDQLVTAVFSANCGGWTENNDTVWYGPPENALRGVADFQDGPAAAEPDEASVLDRLETPPEAYCARDTTYFRWNRTYPENELRDMINERYHVGDIDRIVLGDRGVSGRLKWVRIIGSEDTQTIHKELPIRLAFGGLPSAMFVLNQKTKADGASVYTFTGGGRGHGVGLCQHGAQGMAEQGKLHDEILRHYFSGADVETFE